MREQVEIHLHHLGVVGDLLAGSRPVVEVARAKVGSIEVTLSFRQGEFVRHIDESRDIDTCHLKCRHVPTVVVDHGQALANMFDRFAFFGVVMQ